MFNKLGNMAGAVKQLGAGPLAEIAVGAVTVIGGLLTLKRGINDASENKKAAELVIDSDSEEEDSEEEQEEAEEEK